MLWHREIEQKVYVNLAGSVGVNMVRINKDICLTDLYN